MGWAAGFRAGTDMSKQWIDTYRDAERRRLFEEAQKDKPFKQYTAEQGDALRKYSEMTDAEGRKMYDISIDPGSTEYKVRPITYAQGPLRGEYTPDFGRMPAPRAPDAEYYQVPEGLGGGKLGQGVAYGEGVPVRYAPAERGLSVGEGNFSADLAATRVAPENTAAYGALTRQLGEAQSFNPAVTSYLGKTYEGEFTPAMQRAGLINRYADIIAREDPIKAEQMRTAAAQEERAAKEFELGQKIKNIQLKTLERGEKDAEAVIAMTDAIAKDPSLLRGNLQELAGQFGVSPKSLNQIVADYAGVDNTQLTMMGNGVKRAFMQSRGNLDTFLKMTLDDKDYDPTSHMVQRPGPNGGVILDIVETLEGGKAGRVINSLPEVGNSAEAMDLAYSFLTNPGNIAQTLLKNDLTRAQTDYYDGRAEYARSGGARGLGSGNNTAMYRALVTERGGLVRDRDAIDRQIAEIRNKNSPEYKALVTQRNDLQLAIDDLDGEIKAARGSRSGGGGGLGAEQPKYKVGQVYDVPDGKGGYTRYEYTGDPKKGRDGFVEVKGEPKAAPKAEPKANDKPTTTVSSAELQKEYEKQRREMSEGKRMQYTPEVAKFVKDRDAAETAARRKENEEASRARYEAEERKRVRGLIGNN